MSTKKIIKQLMCNTGQKANHKEHKEGTKFTKQIIFSLRNSAQTSAPSVVKKNIN
jgi:hypothetical protein